ncbi:MAG: heme lyase CcmF/NrfE family subunit [Gammaproteobacteria bacterium]|jgi:cytochrome c-type biogenesis protein CcmF|nr:heme lyase CcmF/NrfE family subunit [Gammaproteobacteria bacterium]MBT3859546.1 heme lyase CcmF/NrfE family subunit [Gammaproteobacteria bacterium]MBT3986560.1 heme lyase CcmF/NrfE family subunit [Gammaproteobacteria bacterium]MBT4581096.1 heme lyase CcmF/NrfE family subunit [Gammaproteobacteria bacterium]MBT4660013.1 heme lyase CcmF/NrfE family subunit [Gammaproteobacteria bacterium]
MIPELGSFSLILALCLSIILGTLPLVGASRNNALWMNLSRPLSAGIFVFLGIGVAILAYAFLTDDFSVKFVAEHSNTLLPDRYKFTAVWGGHEGSFLLWTFMMSGWMLAVAAYSKTMPMDFVARVLGVLGILCTAYILFMLATSNPFARIVPLPPADGADLNSALQDFAFIIHPPTLYMGYVGFSVVFAFAIAALLSGRMDAAWARWCRPWANIAWAILTIGIALGSWWAYYELGWGGYWAWDPVENPPLITWLFGTALIHSLAVTEKRGVFKSWTILLAILAFAGSLLGTFITRSGLLTSVHAFAADPTRGVFILGILGLAVGGSLMLYALRAPLLKTGFGFDLLSRELLLLTNNVILVVAAASIFLGTLFPMVYQAITDDLISIGPPYFNTIFNPLMVLLVLALGIGPLSRWKKTSFSYLLAQLGKVAIASLLIGVVLPLIVILEFSWVATLAVSLASWISLAMLKDLRNKTANKPTLLKGLRSLSLSYYGMQAAHFGCALMLIGVALSSAFSSEKSVLLAPGESVDLDNYIFAFNGTQRIEGPNYIGEEAEISVTRDGRAVEILTPEKRVYLATGAPSTEMSIDSGLFRDLFVTLGEERGDGAWSMSIYVKPFIRWVWLGSIFMAFGGCIAAGDKRYRRLRKKSEELEEAKVEAQLQPSS